MIDSRSGSPSTIVFPTPEELTGHRTPSPQSSHKPLVRHVRSQSSNSQRHERDDSPAIDPDLQRPPLHSHSHVHGGINHHGLPDVHTSLPVGLAQSMGNSIPRSHVTSAPAELHSFQFRPSPIDYPSPSFSGLPSPHFVSDLTGHDSPSAMLPPFRTMPGLSPPLRIHHAFGDEPLSIADHRTKRLRVGGYGGESSPMAGSPLPMEQSIETPEQRSSVNTYSQYNGAPLTPGSSIASDDHLRNSVKVTASSQPFTITSNIQDPPDLRRLSVQSLLTDNEEIKPWRPSYTQTKYPLASVAEETTTYGYDLGLPDLDTPRNDDLSAILPFSPPQQRRESMLHYLNANGESEYDDSPFNPFSATSKVIAFEPGGYYASPVPIKIPFALEPLPPILMENKMNLLYFHHFLNHTARILVPHDCTDNPFRSVLPESECPRTYHK